MASHNVPSRPSLVVTETEAGVLALYDQLQQLQLELALLQSQQDHHASGQSPRAGACCRNTKPPVLT
jgi:hypothetical protein